MKFETIKIGPEKAKKLLANQITNRPPKMNRVAQYAADMAAGRWSLTPQPVIILKGKMSDGQHRMLAVIKSGVEVEFVVCYTDIDTTDDLDKGAVRKLSDVLKIKGYDKSRLVASISTKILMYKNGGRALFLDQSGGGGTQKQNVSITGSMVQEFFTENTDLIYTCAEFSAHLYKASSLRLLTESEIGFLYWLFGMDEKANLFLTSACTGIGLVVKSPELAFRRILEDRKSKVKVVLPSELLKYAVSGFEKFKKGEQCEFLRIKK